MSEQLIESLAKTAIRVFVEWGNALCEDDSHKPYHLLKSEPRYLCPKCWEELCSIVEITNAPK